MPSFEQWLQKLSSNLVRRLPQISGTFVPNFQHCNANMFPRSVGCVVIELLEGHPPYHTLDPMPALFRIVQDDCPPIPEGASPIVKDFLYHCFQKDSNLRISGKKLLRHPWMVSARRQMDGRDNRPSGGPTAGVGSGAPGEKAEKSTASAGDTQGGEKKRHSNYNYDEAVLKVQEWNEALKCEYYRLLSD